MTTIRNAPAGAAATFDADDSLPLSRSPYNNPVATNFYITRAVVVAYLDTLYQPLDAQLTDLADNLTATAAELSFVDGVLAPIQDQLDDKDELGSAAAAQAASLPVGGTAANSSQLLGGTWAIPGTIGSTTPNTGAFTTGAFSSTLVGALTTDATSPTTGAWKTAGGLGVAKALWVGGLLNVADTFTCAGEGVFSMGTVVNSPTGGAGTGVGLVQTANNSDAALSYTSIDFTVPTTGLIGQFFSTASNYVNAGANLPANSVGLAAYATSGSLTFAAAGASGDIRFSVGGFTPVTNEVLRILPSGLRLNGLNAAAGGVLTQWEKAAAAKFYIGHESAIWGGASNSNNAMLYFSDAAFSFKVSVAGASASDNEFVVSEGAVAVAGTFDVSGATTFGARDNHKPYTVATLPAAGAAGGTVYASDAAGAACLAFSNGANWKRCDNAVATVV